VVGGAGLRPLETRAVGALPGPVASLDEQRAVLCVRDTDPVRDALVGLPLVRHRSLLVLRRPEEVVVVAGRDEPFGEPEVRSVLTVVRARLPDLLRGWQVEDLLTRLVTWLEG
jgi:hypothetical protein